MTYRFESNRHRGGIIIAAAINTLVPAESVCEEPLTTQEAEHPTVLAEFRSVAVTLKILHTWRYFYTPSSWLIPGPLFSRSSSISSFDTYLHSHRVGLSITAPSAHNIQSRNKKALNCKQTFTILNTPKGEKGINSNCNF